MKMSVTKYEDFFKTRSQQQPLSKKARHATLGVENMDDFINRDGPDAHDELMEETAQSAMQVVQANAGTSIPVATVYHCDGRVETVVGSSGAGTFTLKELKRMVAPQPCTPEIVNDTLIEILAPDLFGERIKYFSVHGANAGVPIDDDSVCIVNENGREVFSSEYNRYICYSYGDPGLEDFNPVGPVAVMKKECFEVAPTPQRKTKLVTTAKEQALFATGKNDDFKVHMGNCVSSWGVPPPIGYKSEWHKYVNQVRSCLTADCTGINSGIYVNYCQVCGDRVFGQKQKKPLPPPPVLARSPKKDTTPKSDDSDDDSGLLRSPPVIQRNSNILLLSMASDDDEE